jgi:hypothetical protein
MLPTLVYGPSKEILLSRLAGQLEGHIFVPRSAQNPITVPAAAGAVSGLSSMVVANCPEDGWLLLSDLACTLGGTSADAQARTMIEIFDNTTYQRSLSNRPVLVNHVFGNVTNPFFMEEYGAPLLLHPQQDLVWRFTNPSTAGTCIPTVRFNALKVKLPALSDARLAKLMAEEKQKSQQITPYWLVMDSNIPSQTQVPGVQLAAGASNVEVYFTNKNDVTLVLGACMFSAVKAAGGTGDAQELFSFEAFDARTQKPLQSQPVPSNCGAGTAAFPYLLQTPIFVAPNQYLKMRLNNLMTDRTLDVFFTWFGVAVYTGGHSGNFDWKGNYIEDAPPLPIKSLRPLELAHA